MIVYCILTYGLILLVMVGGLVSLAGKMYHLLRNISELPKEIGQLFKAYRYIN